MDLVELVKARLEYAQRALISANAASAEGRVVMMMHQLGVSDCHINEAGIALGDPSFEVDDKVYSSLQSSFERASQKLNDARAKILEIGCRNAVFNSLNDAKSSADPYELRFSLSYARFASRFLDDADLSARIKSAEVVFQEKYVASYLASALRSAEKGRVAEMEADLDSAMLNGFLEDISDKVRSISRFGYKNALYSCIENARKSSLIDSEDVHSAVEQMENNVLNARLYAKRIGRTVEKVLSGIRLSGYKNALTIAVGKSESSEGKEQQRYIELGLYCSAKVKELSE